MLHFDSETRSLLDLKKVGSAAYAEHPSTEMFSACWFDDQTNDAWIWTPTPLINYKEPELPVVAGVKPKLVEYAKGRAVPGFVQELAKREWSAWNGFGFDKLIMEARGLPCPPKWIDPMRASAVLGLPKSLDAAAFVLFGERKNAVAVSTLKKVCRLLPEGSRKSYSKNSVALTSENLALLTTYCLKDCMLLAGIYKLIQPLFDNPAFDFERLVSELDITMNDMGLLADLDLARLMIRKGQDDIREKCKALAPLLLPYTDLLSKSKKAKLLLEEDKVLAVAKLQGKALQKLITALGGPELPKTLAGNPKADKNTLAEIVAAGVPKDCEAVIDLRQAATRPFNAKALAAERCVSRGAVLRWMTRYYGAHTGRFSGAGIQPQNFPGAPDDFDPEKALQDLKFGTSEDFGRDCNALARCILKARPGKGFIVVDLSGIELRTAFWLVRDLETLEIVVSKDIYKEVAAKLYQKTVTEVTKQERQVGKIVVLSGIYQAGVPSYQKQMRLRGIKLEDIGLKVEELRDNFRNSYPRLAHKETGIWALCEQALSLVLDPDSEGLFQEAGRLRFRRAKKIGNHPGRLKMPDGSPAPDAVVELPSGNFRFYRNLAKQTFPEAVAWGKEFTRLSGLSSGASELSEEDFTEEEEEEELEEEENLEEWKRRDQSQLSCDRYRSKTSRDMLYGGKVFQGCFTEDTRVLTANGWKRIVEVSDSDLLWDGVGWYSHGGLVYKGEREVLEWQGVRATADHEILVGKKWKPWIRVVESASEAALETGRALVPSQLLLSNFKGCKGKRAIGLRSACATAVGLTRRFTSFSQKGRVFPVVLAATRKVAPTGVNGTPSRRSSSTAATSTILGRRVIRRCSHVVWTRPTPTGGATVVAGSKSSSRGSKTVRCSFNMLLSYQTSAQRVSILTGLTTTGTTSRVTSASCRVRGISVTAPHQRSLTKALIGTTQTSARGSPRSGTTAPYTTTSHPGAMRKRSSGTTAPTYDIADAGPRHRFCILTEAGPLVVHNCNQAVARDLLAAAMLKIQAEVSAVDGCCVLSVHDEVVVEVALDKLEPLARRVGELLTTRPAWAPDLPLGSEIFTCSSYRKSAQKGWPCGAAKDGAITKWEGWEVF